MMTWRACRHPHHLEHSEREIFCRISLNTFSLSLKDESLTELSDSGIRASLELWSSSSYALAYPTLSLSSCSWSWFADSSDTGSWSSWYRRRGERVEQHEVIAIIGLLGAGGLLYHTSFIQRGGVLVVSIVSLILLDFIYHLVHSVVLLHATGRWPLWAEHV